jgi:hypothetical protein
MVFAQFAALTDSHTPHFANDHCCLLCHIGVLPFLQPDSGVSDAPAARVQWLARDPECVLFHDAFLISRSSRAPPATLPVSTVQV